jgi:F0F1-type ATP synthase epsilon subunit
MLEGVLKIEEVLRVIIKAESAVVPDELYRTGRRYRRLNAKGNCEHKKAKRHRKEKLLAKTCHPTLRRRTSFL